MFKYTGKDENMFKVLDTEDGVTESVDGETLRKILNDGIVIEGISFNDNGDIQDDDFGDILYAMSEKNKNSNLSKAKKAKNDEFYTQLVDIEKELSRYPEGTFKDKIIYCPMDVATNTGAILQSQFVKYFQMNAHKLQFKKLIATCLVEKAAGEGVSVESAQNCYILERKIVSKTQRAIHTYSNNGDRENIVVGEKDNFGMKYVSKDGSQHPVPYHIVNQAVTEAAGKIKLIAQYIDHYDESTGKPILGDKDRGIKWNYNGVELSKKWCRKHPDGTIEELPLECYFLNENDIIDDFSTIPKDENGKPCYEDIPNGSVCLLPSEYYDYTEVDYDDYDYYYSHCPFDTREEWGSGDFRSSYCKELLDECDIVVTNPPFSLFREFIAWIMEANKKFIIWGNNNAIIYKEFFPLLKENKVWLGYLSNKTCVFRVDSEYKYDEKLTASINDGYKYGKVPAISTFTNIDIDKHHEKLILCKNYNPDEYPKYDNYDAINVDKVTEIPCDYDGVMGVPITYLDKYSPDQFEIVGFANGNFKSNASDDLKKLVSYVDGLKDKGGCPLLDGKLVYPRILIRKKVGG